MYKVKTCEKNNVQHTKNHKNKTNKRKHTQEIT